MPEALLFSRPTSGPIEVAIVNPRSVVQLGVLREGDHEVGIISERGRIHDSAFVMNGDRLTVTLPDVSGTNPAGIRLYVPAGSTVNYRSDSGRFLYRGNSNPRDNWWLHRDDDPAPPLHLTYEANNGVAEIIGLTGSVDAFEHSGHIQVTLHDGVGVARTSTGSIDAAGSGSLSVHAEEPGSTILLAPPCDLDLTVHPGAGAARFGFVHESGVPLASGTYHAAAKFVTSRPPEGGRVVEEPRLTITRAKSSSQDAARTASAVLTGPSESGRAAGQPTAAEHRPAGQGHATAQPTVTIPDGHSRSAG